MSTNVKKTKTESSPTVDGITVGDNKKSDGGQDAGQAELQEIFDEAEEKGYFGTVPDPTPNENYSLETPPDAPTPETDANAAREAREATAGRVGALERKETRKAKRKSAA